MKLKSTLRISMLLMGALLFAAPVYASHGRHHNNHAREHQRHHHQGQHEQEFFFGFPGPPAQSCCNSRPGRNGACCGNKKVWIDGYWDWFRGGYLWVEGSWTRRPSNCHWVKGHWKYKKHHWVWVAAHWSKH